MYRRPAIAPRAPGGGANASQIKSLFDGVAYDEVPLDAMRVTIAARLTEAAQEVA